MGHDIGATRSLPLDTCDACPAPATVTVRLASGGEVLLCGSHARRHAGALLQQGAEMEGEYAWQGPPAARVVVEASRPLPYSEPEWHNPREQMSWLGRFLDRFLKPHEVRGYPRPT